MAAVVEIPGAGFVDGRYYSGPGRVLRGEENECLWGDVGWASFGRLRSCRLGMGAKEDLIHFKKYFENFLVAFQAWSCWDFFVAI